MCDYDDGPPEQSEVDTVDPLAIPAVVQVRPHFRPDEPGTMYYFSSKGFLIQLEGTTFSGTGTIFEKKPYPKPDLRVILNLMDRPNGLIKLRCVPCQLGSLGQLQKETSTLFWELW